MLVAYFLQFTRFISIWPLAQPRHRAAVRSVWGFTFIEFCSAWAPTDYIYGGVKGTKMIPRDFKTQEKWTQPGWFEDSFSLNFALPGHHFGGPQGCQNDAQGTQKGAKMMPGEPKSQGKWTQGHPKGRQWEQKRKNIENMGSPPLDLGTHFDTFSPKDEQKWQRDDFLEDLEPTRIFSRNFSKTGEPRIPKMC